MIDKAIRKSIRDYLQSQKNELIKLTQDLCAFATENPPGCDFKPCVDFLSDLMRSEGFKTQKVRVPKAYVEAHTSPAMWDYPRWNLISRWDIKVSKTIHFNSHFDVVPAGEGWKTNPFNPTIKGKRLYGRGTSDMKGCLAASIFAAKALKACGLKPSWNMEFSFTCDEEIGGECGVGYIVKEKLVKPDAAVVCEGGDGHIVAYGHRGVLWGNIEVTGVSAHGSSPKSGINAFEKGINVAKQLLVMHENVKERKTNYPMNSKEFERPTLTMGGVAKGGTKINIIPDMFRFSIDRRLIPEESVSQVKKDFNNVLNAMKKADKNLKAKFIIQRGFSAGISDPHSSLCQTAKEIVNELSNKPAELLIFGAFTDLHFFTNQAKCPSIGYGVKGAGLHSNNEYLEIQSLIDTAQVYAELALRMP